MIERLLGGAPEEPPAGRSLSEIDTALAHRVFEVLVDTLSAPWNEFLGLRLALASVEPQHANVELAPPSEAALAVTIEGRDDAGTGRSRCCSLLVDRARGGAARRQVPGRRGRRAPREDEGGAMRTAIGAIGVELRAEVGAKMLTLGEVLALSPGDVLRLGPAGTEGLFGGGERLHRVRPGRSGNRRAVQIVEAAERR